ncbi:hypothetical protein Leryth_012220 [Lithospermum erythrorhizon]|nr:hypothetical protein Leryth_012220 [Lithospermum erythrorhizon]
MVTLMMNEVWQSYPPANVAQKRPHSSSPSGNIISQVSKRNKVGDGNSSGNKNNVASWREEFEQMKKESVSSVIDYTNPSALVSFVENLDSGKYGSVTRELDNLVARRDQIMCSFYAQDPSLIFKSRGVGSNKLVSETVILEDGPATSTTRSVTAAQDLIVIDSDDEGPGYGMSLFPYQNLFSNSAASYPLMNDRLIIKGDVAAGSVIIKDKGEYVGEDDDIDMEDSNEQSDDGLGDIWQEMNFVIESNKDATTLTSYDEPEIGSEDNCEHSFILKDDIGYVCRICGKIQKAINDIIEYQFPKATKNLQNYWYEGRTTRKMDTGEINFDSSRFSEHEFVVTDVAAHPRHQKQMKPHQVEGFNFLVSNLVVDNPGGCIMAHAPGSGKTFMIISFLQSFMAKYPHSRPLVVLPKGILGTWKTEFEKWQVEDLPLYDFYSVKADSRVQQLEVLKQWADNRSILFLSYKQFSVIVCDNDSGKTACTCQKILLTCPSILILDEGHTPRNQDTDVLTSLEKVETPRKVVLSGTLYQNHVKEVFNILNLVCPKFLRLETPKAIKRRILSRANMSGRRNLLKKSSDNDFYEMVEHTLLKDNNSTRKMTVIQDLREMTSKILHYYKGDFLDELPGLVDFTVLLNLSPSQVKELKEVKKYNRKFKVSSEGSALYVHPQLRTLSKNTDVKDRVDEQKIDALLERLDSREGVKAKFFMNLLGLCESTGEKLLVFSQYLLPLKFLERLTINVKGYSMGREIFMITGDSDNDFREAAMERFNNSSDARVFFGSIKACGEGVSLVGASRIIILDVHLNPSVTRQAIGRAFRPGQLRKVVTYRLVASDSPEQEDHETCFRKESIAKMWFEWNEYSGCQNFEIEPVDMKSCGDLFLESPRLSEDITAVYKR